MSAVTTQNEALRKRFPGTPENVVTYFGYVAEEVRQIIARLGTPIHTHTYRYIHIHTYIHTNKHTSEIHTNRVHIYTYMHTYIKANTYTGLNQTFAYHTYIHLYKPYIHTYIHNQ